MKYDIVIIGAGIVGLGTAYRLSQKNPNLSICILEKEKGVARHQTGHNSGVIHSGIYYKPGSLKAINCKKGYNELLVFAKDYGVKHDVCGKVIVATKESERALLDNIYKRGVENGISSEAWASSMRESVPRRGSIAFRPPFVLRLQHQSRRIPQLYKSREPLTHHRSIGF